MRRLAAIGGMMLLAACTQTQVSREAQLFCAVAAAAGPMTVALIDAGSPTLAPVTVTTKLAVDAACKVAGGVPVPPPTGPVPTMAILLNP